MTTRSGGLIGLKAAAAEVGMHYMTVYRWVRTGRLPAERIGGEWQVDPADLAAALSESPSGDGQSQTGHRTPRRKAAMRRLEARLLAGDEPGAWSVVEAALAQGADPGQVHLELLLPAMRSIGSGWQAGEVTIAAEHRATAVAQRIVGRMGPHFVRRGRRRGVVVCGAAPGDLHALPVSVASDLLRGASFHVIDLGADPPPESFAHAVTFGDLPLAVVIAATRSENDASVGAAISAVMEAEPTIPVVVGGPGVAPDAATALGATVAGRGLDRLVETIEEFRG